jgi:hypothetical protein
MCPPPAGCDVRCCERRSASKSFMDEHELR